jgi:CHAD domain-containing protein
MKNTMQNAPESDSPQPILVLVQCLDDCWMQYRAELKRTRSEFAEEYVHDLRIAIRRLIAAIEMGRGVAGQKKMKKLRRLLKLRLDAFDTLRDVQVQLVFAEEMQAELPEIAAYRDHLREREKRLALRLKKEIKDFRSAGLSQQVNRLKAALLRKNAPETQAAIWAIVDDAYASVVQDQIAIRPEDTATIHCTRLAFKKFRYRVESIHPLLTGAPEDLLRRLHNYQSAMGDVQDTEIGLQMLDKFVAHSGSALPTVRARFIEMRQARIAAFIDQIDNLKTFWRPTPDKEFPWEI